MRFNTDMDCYKKSSLNHTVSPKTEVNKAGYSDWVQVAEEYSKGTLSVVKCPNLELIQS
jgi:hypothetical protein